MLRAYRHEVILVITLDNNSKVINQHLITGESTNKASVSKKQIAQFVLRDNASRVIIAHNHPDDSPKPSGADISFTQEISVFLRELGITLTDHVIVGENGATQSLKGDPEYAKYFD